MIIPDVYEGLLVNAIGERAFYANGTITGVRLPQRLVRIGGGGFRASGITSIVLPSSLREVGGTAFTGCNKLAYNVVGGCKYLPSETNPHFLLTEPSDSNLTSVAIPSDTRLIEEEVFFGYSGITSLSIDANNPYLSTDGTSILNKDKTQLALMLKSGVESYAIPSTVTTILKQACMYQTLSSVTFPSTLTSIEDEAFSGCQNLASIALPGALANIGLNAFAMCPLKTITVEATNTHFEADGKALYDKGKKTLLQYAVASTDTSFSLPDSVNEIGSGAFAGATGLKSVVTTSSSLLTSIGDYAFASCTALTDVALPSSLKSVGDGAFSYCSALTTVTYGGSKADWAKLTLGTDWHNNSTLLKVVACSDGTVTL